MWLSHIHKVLICGVVIEGALFNSSFNCSLKQSLSNSTQRPVGEVALISELLVQIWVWVDKVEDELSNPLEDTGLCTDLKEFTGLG